MRKFKTGGLRRHGIAYSLDTGRLMGDPLSLVDVRLAQERFPKIHFHPLREHAGLALQSAG